MSGRGEGGHDRGRAGESEEAAKEARERKFMDRARFLAAVFMVSQVPTLEACSFSIRLGSDTLSGIPDNERPADAPESLPTYKEMADRLKGAVGEDVLAYSLQMQGAYAERPAVPGSAPRVSGFEELDIPDRMVGEFVSAYPRSWTANVGEVSLVPHLVPVNYPGLEGWSEFGHCERSWTGDPIRIEFTSEDLKRGDGVRAGKVRELLGSMTHEFAHAADWSANPKLDARRVLILMFMTERAIADGDRPKFDYPESIKTKDPSGKQAETATRMSEYFAELMTVALDETEGDGWDAWRDSFEDRLVDRYGASDRAARANVGMVRRYFEWTEPDFKPWRSAALRGEVGARIEDEHVWRSVGREIDGVKDAEIRAALRKVLEDRAHTVDDAKYETWRITGYGSYGKYHGTDATFSHEAVRDDRAVKLMLMWPFRSMVSILEAVVVSRNNRFVLRLSDPGRYDVSLGNATVEDFSAELAALPAGEREEMKRLLVRLIAEGSAKAPGSDVELSLTE